MPAYEYKVVPAPTKSKKTREAKGLEGRFAMSLQTALNEVAADGWEFVRAETLPSDERSGLTGSHTVYRSVLVFRREVEEEPTKIVPSRPVRVAEPKEEALSDEPVEDQADETEEESDKPLS